MKLNLTDEQKKQLVQAFLTAFVTLVLAVAGILGYNVALSMVQPQAQTIGVESIGVQPAQTFRALTVINSITNNGTLTQTGAATFGTTTETTANITTLNVGGQAQSGAVRYGTAATYTSGSSIAHGFTVTPTVCMISPMQAITSTYTITTTGFSTNMPTTASPIYWMCGK
jgi:hypothetical protein